MSDDLAAELEKEAPAMPEYGVRSEDGLFSVTVRASAAPTVRLIQASEREHDYYQIEAAFGERKLVCAAYGKRNLGALLQARVNALAKAVDQLMVDAISSGASADRPWLAVRVRYAIKQQGVFAVGEYKLATGRTSGGTLLCTTDQLGNRAAFRASFERALATFDTPQIRAENGSPPSLHEVYQVSAGEVLAGFRDARLMVIDGGFENVNVYRTTLLRVGGVGLAVSDSYSTRHSKGGEIELSLETRHTNQKEDFFLRATRQLPDRYHVAGLLAGGNVSGVLVSNEPLLSDLAIEQKLAELTTREVGAAFSTPVWNPNIDPLRLSRAQFTRIDASSSPFNVRFENEKVPLDYRLSGDGTLLESASRGDPPVVTKRIWSQGASQPRHGE